MNSVQLILVIFGVILAACDCFEPTEVWALKAFREAVFEDPYLAMSNWNALEPNPCEWSGVSCSKARDHVVKLNISGSSIKGFLAPELSLLTYLQELILHENILIGTIPKELGMLKNLSVLDLGMNQLTGPIPPEIGNLTRIVKINLQSNGLTGRLPPEFGNLKDLQELRLDRNRLQGAVPAGSTSNFTTNIHGMYASGTNVTGFCCSSKLKVADFSYNFFVGSIPKCLEYLPRSSFQGNCLEDNDLRHRPTAQCGNRSPAKSHSVTSPNNPVTRDIEEHQGTSKPSWLLPLEIVTGVMVCSIFLVAGTTAVQRFKKKPSTIIPWKKSSKKENVALHVDPRLLKDITRFTRQELEVACEDFSNIIDSSPDRLVYKGTMKGGAEIAVISLCIKEEEWTGYLELYFQKEVELPMSTFLHQNIKQTSTDFKPFGCLPNQVADLARLKHEYIGKLFGYCQERSPFTRMLVFEYASNGTLYEHLHSGEGSQVSWTRRMKIVIGIAHGLKYLHTELNPPFTISDLNSNAIYLTEDFAPKLVDFESWKSILSRSEKYSGSIGSRGSMCALPNYLEERHPDVKGNIYAFGVILLEIISGRLPHCKEKGCLVDWAKEYLDLPEVMSYVVDPELKHFGFEDLKIVCEVVSLCINSNAENRPSMEELCLMLESKIDTSVSVDFKASSLAWAELALS